MTKLLAMTEFELKFEIPPADLKGVAVAVLAAKARRQRLQASYFDTPAGALAACGIVVRLRKEGRRWVQTAKGPTADVLERLEHNAVLLPQSVASLPTLDLSRHRATPVGKAIDKALGLQAGATYPQLDLLYSTDIQRITRQIAIGNSTIEVALDQGRVFSDGLSLPICELEIELKEGTPADAVALALEWCTRHGIWISTIAKSMKGQRLRSATPFGEATSAVSAKFSRHASGAEMVTAVIHACMCQILPNMSELAAGSNQPDHVHQLRVGIRRLRTALGELGRFTDDLDPAWDAALVQAFRALGAHRDKSHLALVLQPQLLDVGGPAVGVDLDDSATPDPAATVRAADFQCALLGLLSLVHREVPKPADKPEALQKSVAKRLDKLRTRALRDGKKFLVLDEAGQHGVRKRLKRLRYLLEFVEPLFPARKVRHMATSLKPAQDALGQYNDELVALHALRALAADDPNAWFGVGWLSARVQPNAKRCLKEIKRFAEIKPFWRG